MKKPLMLLGLAGLLGFVGCAHIEEKKRKDDAEFKTSETDSRYLLTTDEMPAATPR